METVISINKANIEDAQEIASVHIASWQVIYRGSIPNYILDNLSLSEYFGKWQKWLSNSNCHVLTISINEKIAGFTSFGSCRDEIAKENSAEIWTFYLSPNYWRQGLGSQLMQEAFDSMILLGFNNVSVWVLETNQQAIAFYKSAGFFPVEGLKVDNSLDGLTLREIRLQKIL